MNETRTQLSEKSAQERKEIAQKAADEWYSAEQKKLETGYNANKKTLEKQLEDVRDYYSRLEEEEGRADRNKELGKLYGQASIYQNTATREGQNKYKSILSLKLNSWRKKPTGKRGQKRKRNRNLLLIAE